MSATPIHPEDLEKLGNGSDFVPEQASQNSSNQGLIDPEDLIEQPQATNGTQKAAWRLGSKWVIGGSIGLVLALIALFMLSAFASIFGARRGNGTATANGPSEVERLQAELERAQLEANRERAIRLLDVPESQLRTLGPDEPLAAEPEAEAPPTPEEPIEVADRPITVPRTPAPVVRTPPRPTPAPAQPARPAPAPRPAAPAVDPMQRWEQLAFGGVTSAVAPRAVAAAEMPPELPAASREPIQLEVDRVSTPGTQGILDGKPPEPEVKVEPPSPAVVLPGTAIGAVQTQPVIYNSATGSAYSLSLITLSEPLLDDVGQEVLPTGTQLVVEVANVAVVSPKRALVKQWATQAIVTEADGSKQIIDIPSETIAVIGSEKEDGQLIAKSVSSSGGGFGRTLALAALGAVREVGRVANRPESQVVSSGSFGNTVSTTNGDDDIVAAVFSGAADPLLARAQNDIRRDIDRRDPIFLIPADTPVTVTLEKTWQPNV